MEIPSLADAPDDFIPAKTMEALPLHAGWLDGRTCYEWCRIEAVLCADRKLRAELTWDDCVLVGSDRGSVPIGYTDAQLLLESNTPDRADPDRWVTYDSVWFPISREEALALVARAPEELLTKYADKIAALVVPEAGS